MTDIKEDNCKYIEFALMASNRFKGAIVKE